MKKIIFILKSLILSGILTASTLQHAQAHPFDDITLTSDQAFAEFAKVYIAPVSVDLPEASYLRTFRTIQRERPVSDVDQALKAQDVHDEMVEAFQKRSFEVVDRPADDVLTVEIIMTRLASTKPTRSDVRFQPGLDFSLTVYAGGADFLVQLKQGETVLANIQDDYRTTFNDGRPRIALWQDADRSIKSFSRKLAKYVSKN